MQRILVLKHRSPEKRPKWWLTEKEKEIEMKSGKRTNQNWAIMRLRSALPAESQAAAGELFFFWCQRNMGEIFPCPCTQHADGDACGATIQIPIWSDPNCKSQSRLTNERWTRPYLSPHLLSSPSPKCYPYVSIPFRLPKVLLCYAAQNWQCYYFFIWRRRSN